MGWLPNLNRDEPLSSDDKGCAIILILICALGILLALGWWGYLDKWFLGCTDCVPF